MFEQHENQIFGLEGRNMFYSQYPSIVRDNKDPEKRGRIQVDIPQMFGDQHYDVWILPQGQPIGAGQGMFWIPSVGDTVWVSFEQGDQRFPVWSHGYVDKDKAMEDLYDDSGEPVGVIFQDVHGNRVTMNKNGISLISDKAVSLGTLDKSKEKAVLGETLEKLLKELNQYLEQLTVNTAMGPSSIPINIQDFINLAEKYKQILSDKVTLD